jgi:hypothetical protein
MSNIDEIIWTRSFGRYDHSLFRITIYPLRNTFFSKKQVYLYSYNNLLLLHYIIIINIIKNITEIDNPGAGNCFFYAVVIGLYHRKEKNGDIIIPDDRFVVKKGKELRVLVMNKMKQVIRNNNNFRDGIISSEIDRRIDTRQTINTNVSILLKSYVKDMGENGTWGGHPEAVIMRGILQEFGFKGLSIYEKKKGKFIKLNQFGNNRNNNKPYTEIRLRLHEVERGGMHFTTLV